MFDVLGSSNDELFDEVMAGQDSAWGHGDRPLHGPLRDTPAGSLRRQEGTQIHRNPEPNSIGAFFQRSVICQACFVLHTCFGPSGLQLSIPPHPPAAFCLHPENTKASLLCSIEQ